MKKPILVLSIFLIIKCSIIAQITPYLKGYDYKDQSTNYSDFYKVIPSYESYLTIGNVIEQGNTIHKNGMLMRLEENGDPMFFKPLPFFTTDLLELGTNGNIYVLGEEIDNASIPHPRGYHQDVLYSTTPSGNERFKLHLNAYRPGSGSEDSGFFTDVICESHSGNVLVAGLDADGFRNIITLAEINDQDGSIIQTNSIEIQSNPDLSTHPLSGFSKVYDIQPTHDGGYLLLLGIQTINPPTFPYWTVLLKIDGNLDFSWRKSYQYPMEETDNSLTPIELIVTDQSYYVLGRTIITNNNGYWTGTSPFLMKTGLSGLPIWYRSFESDLSIYHNNFHPASFTLTNNSNSVLIAGNQGGFGVLTEYDINGSLVDIVHARRIFANNIIRANNNVGYMAVGEYGTKAMTQKIPQNLHLACEWEYGDIMEDPVYVVVSTFAVQNKRMRVESNIVNSELVEATYSVTNYCGTEGYSPKLDVNTIPSTSPTLTLFPNPSQGSVQLSWDTDLTEESQVRVLDISGKTIRIINIPKDQKNMTISELPKGMYLVELKNSKIQEVQKLIVE